MCWISLLTMYFLVCDFFSDWLGECSYLETTILSVLNLIKTPVSQKNEMTCHQNLLCFYPSINWQLLVFCHPLCFIILLVYLFPSCAWSVSWSFVIHPVICIIADLISLQHAKYCCVNNSIQSHFCSFILGMVIFDEKPISTVAPFDFSGV